jgi:hypothetical protein
LNQEEGWRSERQTTKEHETYLHQRSELSLKQNRKSILRSEGDTRWELEAESKKRIRMRVVGRRLMRWGVKIEHRNWYQSDRVKLNLKGMEAKGKEIKIKKWIKWVSKQAQTNKQRIETKYLLKWRSRSNLDKRNKGWDSGERIEKLTLCDLKGKVQSEIELKFEKEEGNRVFLSLKELIFVRLSRSFVGSLVCFSFFVIHPRDRRSFFFYFFFWWYLEVIVLESSNGIVLFS